MNVNRPLSEDKQLPPDGYAGLADVLEQLTHATPGQQAKLQMANERLKREGAGKSQFVKHAPMWTPFEISVLLHHYCSEGDHPGAHMEVYRDTMHKLGAGGLIEYRTALPSVVVTEKGRAFINMLLNTPLPVLQIVDPRSGEVVA